MAGGNSHQRAVERAAKGHMADQIPEAVMARLNQTDKPSAKSENKKLHARLFDFIEHPLVLSALFALAGIVGAFIYTPIFILCAVCILLGFHRAGVVSEQPLKLQVPVYLALALLLSIGGYFTYGALDTAAERYQAAFAQKVAAFLNPTPERKPPMTFVGVHSPNETTIIPPNSYGIISSGPLSPEDRRDLDRLAAEGIEAKRRWEYEPDKLTVLDLLWTDFRGPENNSVRHSGFTIRNGDTGSLTHIAYAVIRQLQAGVEILAFYIPYTNETPRIAMSLAGMHKKPLADFLESIVETGKAAPGDSDQVSSQNLILSNRVFVYHETYLSPEQIVEAEKAWKNQGITVIFRGTDYLDNKRLEARMKELDKR